MSTHDRDAQSLHLRLEVLERQNRRLKQIAVGGVLFLAIGVFCVIAAGGQQNAKGKSGKVKQNAPAQSGHWKLSDGRLVVFPSSVIAERVDPTALDLPPGTKVVGWEPVEDEKSLLPAYAQRVATIPTVKGRIDALAEAAQVLQQEIDDASVASYLSHSSVLTQLQEHGKLLDQYAVTVNQNAALPAANFLAIQNTQRDVDRLKRDLDDFKDAVCPVMRTARLDWSTKLKVDSACGLR